MRNGLEKTPKKKRKSVPYWRIKNPPYHIGRDGFTLKDVKKDYDGWVDPSYCIPPRFDLVLLKCQAKTIPGWWDGFQWEGLRLREGEKVFCWKEKNE